MNPDTTSRALPCSYCNSEFHGVRDCRQLAVDAVRLGPSLLAERWSLCNRCYCVQHTQPSSAGTSGCHCRPNNADITNHAYCCQKLRTGFVSLRNHIKQKHYRIVESIDCPECFACFPRSTFGCVLRHYHHTRYHSVHSCSDECFYP